jgi:predicted patatin/cPLA2 family phospholipase
MTRALVVEGGGMRGAYAAGALAGLRARGERFDAVHAASSGACSAAYLHAEQDEGLRIWQEHLDGAKLLRARNLLVGRPYLDLEYLVDEVFARRVPLDLARLRAAKAPLWVTLTDARTGAAEYRDLRREPDPLRALKATAALPIAYARPVRLGGRAYLDGGMADPIPVARAIAAGADDVTLVLTRPLGYRRAPASRGTVLLGSLPYPGAARAFATLHERYNAALELARDPPAGVRVRAIAPPPTLRLSRLMRRAEDLRRAVQQGVDDAMAG